MDVREKLVELLREAPYNIFGNKLGNCYFDSCLALIADHLTANGVTVPEWISVEDRLPNAEVDVLVLTRSKSGSVNVDKGYFAADLGRFVHRGRAEVSHWMPLPEPPRGE